ncbi:MAG: hypothetical protein JWR37_1221 [Mycobacterium sp.]|jgi:hypothetical protein|nr:hypothetical protein [Mycobacterium sp.]
MTVMTPVYIAADPLERLDTTGLPRELAKLEHILL